MPRPGVRRLSIDDAGAFVVLRREALEREPLAFGASVGDGRGTLEFMRAALADEQEQAVFGYFDDHVLAGIVGVVRASGTKERHKASIWGMYVAPLARGRGAGRALLVEAIEHARKWRVRQVQLSVTDVAATAKRLYEAAGFHCWGREPRALQWEGRFVDEWHFVLDLDQ